MRVQTKNDILMFLAIFPGEMPFRVSNTDNSTKFHINNSEKCNMSNQRIIEKIQFQIKSAHWWFYMITNIVFGMIHIFYICM